MFRMGWPRVVAAMMFAMLVWAGTLRADVVVYDNGAPILNGNEMTEWIQAEDFTLGADTTLAGVRFWDFELATAYTGSITWQIYSSTGTQPGALIDSGNTALVTRAATGRSTFGMSEFQNDFLLDPVALSAGTYWLALHNGPLTTTSRREFYWSATAANGSQGALGKEDRAPFEGTWVSNGQEHAFILYGADATPVVPLPAAAWMGLVLFGGIGIRARFRRDSHADV